MTKKTEIDPLEEWNRLERENTENAIVSSMFDAGLKTSSAINEFSTWLLVGSAGIGAFMVSNADKLIPIICKDGFLVCGLFLCLSSMLGLVSKIFGLLCRVGLEVKDAIVATFNSHLNDYAKVEEEIRDTAKISGVDIKTGIRLERVMAEFLLPMPGWVRWLVRRQQKKNDGNPQQAYVLLVKRFNRQGIFAFLQALCFLTFMVAGVLYASKI
jgi:hypothetical protein